MALSLSVSMESKSCLYKLFPWNEHAWSENPVARLFPWSGCIPSPTHTVMSLSEPHLITLHGNDGGGGVHTFARIIKSMAGTPDKSWVQSVTSSDGIKYAHQSCSSF